MASGFFYLSKQSTLHTADYAFDRPFPMIQQESDAS